MSDMNIICKTSCSYLNSIFIHLSLNYSMMHQFCTFKGILSVLHGIQDLLDLRKGKFFNLYKTTSTDLLTIASMKASKKYFSVDVHKSTLRCMTL
jgi:hypothetical protein